MKSNINKLILIEVIAGILFAFIASKILHMTAALQIMYLPFELIGKGLRFLSLSSAIGNVIAIIIYAVISMIPAIYIIYQRKRGRTQKEDILLVAFTGLLFYSMYMFINPGLMYQKMPDIFSSADYHHKMFPHSGFRKNSGNSLLLLLSFLLPEPCNADSFHLNSS